MNQTFTSFKDFKQRYPIRPNDEGALLGSGSYGRVIKVEDQLETEWVAVKISEFKGNDTKSLKAEVELAKRVPRQTNIARYDACYRLETDTSVSDFAIMKYYPDGNLVDLIRRVVLTPSQIYDITQGILLGLQHLHRHRIVHRDFKPANILISRDNAGRFIPKIADFGLSKLVSDEELDSSDFDLSDGRGTPSYKAPEQIEGSRVSFNLDLWAFGVILYELMTGEKPFRSDLRNSSEQSVRREIEKKIITVDLPARLDQVAEPYQAIIRRCLVRDIHERARKEQELLDLLDAIPQLIAEAHELLNKQEYKLASTLYEQVLAKREHHIEAQKGLEQCAAGLQQQQQASLLKEAENLINQQYFDQAKDLYEQVLGLNPVEDTAIRGLALCLDALRPKPSVSEPELTDVYQEERTDVYVPTPAPVVKPEKPMVVKGVKREPKRETKPDFAAPAKSSAKLVSQPPVLQPISQPVLVNLAGRAFPWRVIAPIALVVGGIVLYMNLRSTIPATSDSTRKPDSTLTAAVGLSIGPKPSSEKPAEVIKPVPGESKEALNKRIDVALSKAQRSYRQKDYTNVIVLTTSALSLDPTRRDVAALRTAALAAIKELPGKIPEEKKTDAPVTGLTESPKVTAPETDKPKPAETSIEAPKNAKLEAQEKYDQLIESGQKAIAKGNNKAKAIADFTEARSLAKDQDLNTAKADAAYTTYMATANRIFDRDELEGAKDWYQVAKSLKDTDEVRRKIKQCTNQ